MLNYSVAELRMKEITVTIPVKYVYTFGERTAQIVVNVTK